MKNYIDAARLAVLKEKFSAIEYDAAEECPAVYVPAKTLTEGLRFLKEDGRFAFNRLENLTAVDYKTYFEMVYHLFSWGERNDSFSDADFSHRPAE